MNHLALGMPGIGEWALILVVLLLVFGARKLPELANAMGRSLTEFKKGLKGPEEVDGGAKTGDKDRT